MSIRRIITLATALGLVIPAVVQGQYFGRNKVQYENFKFEVLRTAHFQVYYYAEERAAAQQAARLAERWYARLSTILHHELRGAQPLVLYASHPHFEQTNTISGELDESTGGVTESLKRRIVLPLAGPLDETDHVIGHELVHAFQYDISGSGRGAGGSLPGVARLPLWFIEGMAEYLSIGPTDPHTTMWLRDAVRRNRIPSIRQLDDPRYFPYRWGQAFWAYLTGRFGDPLVGTLLREASRSGDTHLALEKLTGLKLDSLSRQWQEAIRATYTPIQQATGSPDQFGRRIAAERDQAQLNLAPALSPDGNRVAYFSERGLFAIEMYLADVATGRIQRKLIKTAVDPHYESVGFISSSGAWDAAGQRLAFGAVAHGRPVLSILDVASGEVIKEVPFPSLGQIFNPSWSPDGRLIAFSALVGGWTDLYVYDVADGDLRRLTNDAYADLQPAWSPDGQSLAFVTDRFTTDLVTLQPGSYRLALFTVSSGAIRPLPAFDGAKHINPEWSPDGRSLYYVSDRGGISNVFRLDVAAGTSTQVTNLFVGASGITAGSPVISVAHTSGRLVFTAYDSGGYKLFAVDDERVLAGRAPPTLAGVSGATLPPLDRRPGELVPLLSDFRTGLPPEAEPAAAAGYRPRLSLEYVSQPSLAIGANQYGAFVGGGATLVWGDMLGNRTLATGLQVSGSFRDIAAIVAYQNQASRWNWGIAAQQVPYLTGGYQAGFGVIGGQQVYIEEAFLARQTNRSLTGFVAYPFSRVQRVEVALGGRHISFDEELRTRIFDAQTGALLDESTERFPSGDPITFATGTVALVYDNSYFGATGPLLGQRYRLEVSPSIGSLTMMEGVVDYRRYVMPARKLTLAARVLHAGRYGPDAEDPRLSPLFLGYPGVVRGYNIGSFSAAECPTNPNAGCPVFDRLVGSRTIVGNAEARFPLFGVLGLGGGYYGAFPIEAVLFADAGLAWTESDQHSLFQVRRQAVASAGAALRMNLFGFAIAELNYVKPFMRPDKGWYWQLNLTPGF